MNTVEVVLLPIVLIGISYLVFADLRYTLRKRASKNWPSVEAMIGDGFVGSRGRLAVLPRILRRVHLNYSYSVNGQQYMGQFYVLAQGKTSAEALQQAFVGKKISVRYNNRHPEISFLFDLTIMGKRVMQGPSWTYR